MAHTIALTIFGWLAYAAAVGGETQPGHIAVGLFITAYVIGTGILFKR